MKRNLFLLAFVLVSVLLIVNSTKRLLTFRTTAQKVNEAQARLEKLRAQNEQLKRELEYKKSQEFAEAEIRNKLGLAKEGEAVVIIPGNDESQKSEVRSGKWEPNWKKWQKLFFGS